MNRIFFRTLPAFSAALAVFTVILSLMLQWRLQRSLNQWSLEKLSTLQAYALNVLEGKALYTPVPVNTSLFVYNAARELVFSNRGSGLRRSLATDRSELLPLEKDGETLGYYFAGSLHFANDGANNRFLSSLRSVVWLALLLSFFVAFIFAFLFSRSLSLPARKVAAGLDQISHGNLQINVPESGVQEMALIGRSANRLSRSSKNSYVGRADPILTVTA